MIRAIHEVGHVIVAMALHIPVKRVTLEQATVLVRRNADAAERYCHCVVAMGGPAAEHRWRPTTAAERRLLWAGAGWGGDAANAVKYVPDRAIRLDCLRCALRIVARHWPAILTVAQALQERGTLTGEDVAAVLYTRGARP
jgi:hypothetical protein